MDKTKDIANTYREIELSQIVEDPDNKPIFGDYETDGLSNSIGEIGFLGAVLVYPYGDKFRLQSGHRSVEAAKKAGMTFIPAIIVPDPIDDVERRKKLILANAHERDKTPMRMARMIEYHFETLKLEEKKRREAGQSEKWNITEKVAADLEISTAMVTKYRALTHLITDLQILADKRLVPWSDLSGAAVLHDDLQKVVYRRIQGQAKAFGYHSITRKWLRDEISECKHIIPIERGYQFDRNDVSLYSEVLQRRLIECKKKAGRKKNPARMLRRALSEITEAFKLDPTSEKQEMEMKELIGLIRTAVGKYGQLENSHGGNY